jgi:hypothetical protein
VSIRRVFRHSGTLETCRHKFAAGFVLECGENRRFGFFLAGRVCKNKKSKAAILAALQKSGAR